ncbi:hypothetical protein LAG90_17150 [Marinilongibacter aquaticus]|uniref:M43 family zinc metalloprotease n=1 Tax=Marinilongibacter aquaticus TaxID=2975157 RepID=UPI0021BD6D59|nr:M43 family zinc metalloprotease [Marinilongibacter aquaticus]UBM58532.1 hypothetical protein LAG90_17150 [Marinilongibacter aquaticus]
MKTCLKRILKLIIGLFIPAVLAAQNIDCGLGLISSENSLQKNRQNRTQSISDGGLDQTTVYTIPVVFHVYHIGEAEGTGSNIPSSAIEGMINTLNETYRATGSFSGVTPDTKIQFALATHDPSCNPSNGIVRVNASGISGYTHNEYSVSNTDMHNALRFLSDWPRDSYINIRVVYTDSPIGVGYFEYDAFIPYFRVNNDASNKAFLTHEVGHVLDLAHTFASSCNPASFPFAHIDDIEDTPIQLQGSGCDPNAINACTGQPLGVAVYNFMSYFSCRDRFTNGQKEYMRETIQYYKPGWKGTGSDLNFGTINQLAGNYEASNTISSQANVANQTYYLAGKSISLLAGFQAGSNEVFQAKIDNISPCP